ncbi:MAG: PTS sugar transporter subunit IIA [Planctomycetota bacterium]
MAKKESSSTREKVPLSGEKLSQYIRPEAVIDLVVESKDDLLRSLAEVALPDLDNEEAEAFYQEIESRERDVNTYVGNGVAIPHARVESVERFALAIARNADGFPYGVDTDEPVVLVVLVLGNVELQNEHLQILATIADALVDRDTRDKILEAPDASSVIRQLDSRRAPRRKARPLTQLLMSHAQKIAREMGVTSILARISSAEELAILKRLPRRKKFIVATNSRRLAKEAEKVVERVLLLPKVPITQSTGVRLTALMALTHGLIQKGDVVAFLTGNDGKALDTMTIVEIGKEFGRFVSASGAVGPGIAPEVLERVIALAVELGAEGREGRAVGTIFVVVGDPEKLEPFTQQMVINPFRGYPEEETNILDPTLAETIKEFASIDGGFVVRGDGVVLSAGTFLKVDQDVELPGGLGARHRAGAGITKVLNCVSVTLSQSGDVTLFKSGAELLRLHHRHDG